MQLNMGEAGLADPTVRFDVYVFVKFVFVLLIKIKIKCGGPGGIHTTSGETCRFRKLFIPHIQHLPMEVATAFFVARNGLRFQRSNLMNLL